MASTPAIEAAATPAKSISYGRAVIALLIGTAFLAFSGIWVKAANFEPATSVALRTWLPLILFVPLVVREYRKKGALNKHGIIWSIIAGMILGIDFTAWNYSIFYVGAGIASVLLNLQVIILPLLAFFIDRERIPRSYWFVLPVMAIGIAMVGGVFDGVSGEGPAEVYGIPLAVLGTLLGVLSGVCYGIYLYTSRKATRVNPGRYIQPIAIVSLFQGVPPVIFMFIRGEGFNFTQGMLVDGVLPQNAEGVNGDPINMQNWIAIILLAVLGQFAAWILVQIGSVNMDATHSAGLLLLSPVSTIFIAALMFAEIPSILQIIGVVMVLGAVAYQNDLHKLLLGSKDKVPDGVHISADSPHDHNDGEP